ncbi:hypothetical protein Pden_0065 [Paracoccus denitrificans PD1222]|uniref:Uncharacterized protein n=1 Tax=Paracoccus denitrificans (strain Pd 1222) TaxID=318586 RepID=A1AY38_PARDP|nr:hypothetical protein Pden_0065 [Paracoccus denitrificans PD1222]
MVWFGALVDCWAGGVACWVCSEFPILFQLLIILCHFFEFCLLRVPGGRPKYPLTETTGRSERDGTRRWKVRFWRQSGNERPDGASLEWRNFRVFLSSAF